LHVKQNVQEKFSSLVWHGAVHILLFTVMTYEVIIYTVKKHQRLVYGVSPFIYIIHPWNQSKIWGDLGKIWGACAPLAPA